MYAGASGFLPKLKVETNERDGKSQWITVRPWIGTHPTCQGSRPVLTGEIALRCCIDSPSGCFNVLSAQGARLAIHVSLPTKENTRDFFVLPFDRFVFALYRFARSHTPWCGLLLPPFTVSHDLTHLGRKVREHIPPKKKFTCRGHTDRPILLHFPLISLRDSRQEHSGPGSWKNRR